MQKRFDALNEEFNLKEKQLDEVRGSEAALGEEIKEIKR